MCIPHQRKSINIKKYGKQNKMKHISKPDDYMMKKGDPDFIDERTTEYIPKDKRSLLDKIIDKLSKKFI